MGRRHRGSLSERRSNNSYWRGGGCPCYCNAGHGEDRLQVCSLEGRRAARQDGEVDHYAATRDGCDHNPLRLHAQLLRTVYIQQVQLVCAICM